jgi:hypothetical protein
MFPLPAVVRKVDLLGELPKLPDPVRLALGLFRCHNAGNFFPRLGFGHLADEADGFAFLLAVDPPDANPTPSLFSDTS